MTTTQPSLLQLAKQGDSRAIAILLNRSLQPDGVTAKVYLKDACLYVMVEASEVPKQQTIVPFLQKGLLGLRSPAIQSVKVYGKQSGEETPAWIKTWHIQEDKADLHDTNQETSSDIANQSQTTKVNSNKEHTINSQSRDVNLTNKRNTEVSNKPIYVHSNETSKSAKAKSQDYVYKLIEFIFNTIENWTLRKTAYAFLGVGGFLAITSIGSCNADSNFSGLYTFLIAVSLCGVGCYCFFLDDRNKAERSLSVLVKQAVQEFKQKSPSMEVVEPANFKQIDHLRFAITGVSYETKIAIGHEKQYSGSVAVGNDDFAMAMPVTSNRTVYAEITGKAVVVEFKVHNHNKRNDKVTHIDFTLIDQNSNQYSEHPFSENASALRSGITSETNLRPNVEARYFVVFDVNPDAVALLLAASSTSSDDKCMFSLDLEQKIRL